MILEGCFPEGKEKWKEKVPDIFYCNEEFYDFTVLSQYLQIV